MSWFSHEPLQDPDDPLSKLADGIGSPRDTNYGTGSTMRKGYDGKLLFCTYTWGEPIANNECPQHLCEDKKQ